MPGIIPMKLIKCGSSQTRIAQACDRCRSKKIRCDGVRPCCSQCANVGFECKTSDKLSRRAFPRGYTESLEERVRCLEREVRELKELLDAKDEQLDMISRIHSFSSPYSPPASATSGCASHRMRKSPESVGGRSSSVEATSMEDMIVVGEPSQLMNDGSNGAERIYMGSSSGKPFVDRLRLKMNENGLYTTDLDSEKFFEGQMKSGAYSTDPAEAIKAPPRLQSDHLLVAYFQEFHPLFPVLHRPTFVAAYEKLVSGDTSLVESLPKHAVAQLFLVFSITSLQSEPTNSPTQQFFDSQWQRALDLALTENSLSTVQCLVLAQLYCFARGDYARLLQYKSLAVGIALRLGLNHSQRKFSLGALAGEMRKRTFWCVYCLDGFSAAMLGLPKLLKEEDIDTEYPSDIDDEFISEDGFMPTLPGDSTKISSALALFRLSRVLTNVLNTVYPGSAPHELSYSKLKDLEDELDAWKNGLAPHLRLEFVNGAPSTNLVNSRSPLLIMAYHYIRMLIHFPIIGSPHPHHSSASSMTIRESGRCIVQIVQLLAERKLGFAFCLNRAQLLLLAGFTIMYSAVDSHREGVLAKDNQKLLVAIADDLQRNCSANGVRQRFEAVASLVVSTLRPCGIIDGPLSPPHRSPSQHAARHQQERLLQTRPSSASAKLSRSPTSASARRPSSHDFSNIPDVAQSRARLMSTSLTDLSPLSRARSLHHLQQIAPHRVPKNSVPHSRHSISSYDAPALDFLWNLETGTGVNHRQQSQSNGNSSSDSPAVSDGQSESDWARALAMMDATHAAHIYGDGGNALMPAPPRHHSAVSEGGQHWSPAQPTKRFHTTPSLASFSDASEDGGNTAARQQGIDMAYAGNVNGEALGEFLGPLIPGGVVDVQGSHAIVDDGGWFDH